MKNVSPKLPFVYHTSRCDPELIYHTTTKTEEELLLHVITALIHNGAFLLVDAINPDGSIVPEVYHGLMKRVYAKTKQFEPYVNGNLIHDASIWFASHAKYDPDETGQAINEHLSSPGIYIDAPVDAASILRASNIPFDVIGTRNIEKDKSKVLILSHVSRISGHEMDAIERYIEKGGNLLVTGPIGSQRLEKMLGIKATGRTEHNFTYLSPTEQGKAYFDGFTHESPFTVPSKQYTISVTDPSEMTVLATRTLPYTMTDTDDFAAIHSNPPGIYTDEPAAIEKKIGNSRIIWVEMSRPYMSKLVFERMVRSLIGSASLRSDAPNYVEIMHWIKGDKEYIAVVNEQEEPPIVPVDDITVTLRTGCSRAVLLPDKIELKPEKNSEGELIIHLPKLKVFEIINLI